jgi:hypothetical protein
MRLRWAVVVGAGLVSAGAAAARAQDVVEPRSGVAFAARRGELSLLGVGLRTRTFLKVKVYAVGLYVSDAALRGMLAVHKGKTGAPAFYRDLVGGDFEKLVVLEFVRDVGQETIQEAMREALAGAPRAPTDAFVAYFPEVKAGQQCVLRWGKGGVLETTMAGEPRPPLADREFAARVFAIWLGDSPIQADIKRDLVARIAGLWP